MWKPIPSETYQLEEQHNDTVEVRSLATDSVAIVTKDEATLLRLCDGSLSLPQLAQLAAIPLLEVYAGLEALSDKKLVLEPDGRLRSLDNLVVETLRDERLVYNPKVGKLYCLNEIASAVFECCDGKTLEHTERLIAKKFPNVEDPELVVDAAVTELSRHQLLKSEPKRTRREFIGLSSKAAAMLPVVLALAAPKPAAALSNRLVITSATYGASADTPTGNSPNAGDPACTATGHPFACTSCTVGGGACTPGATDCRKDATAQLQAFQVSPRRVVVTAGGYNTKFGPDPISGVVKDLRVVYTCGGAARPPLKFCENAAFTITCP